MFRKFLVSSTLGLSKNRHRKWCGTIVLLTCVLLMTVRVNLLSILDWNENGWYLMITCFERINVPIFSIWLVFFCLSVHISQCKPCLLYCLLCTFPIFIFWSSHLIVFTYVNMYDLILLRYFWYSFYHFLYIVRRSIKPFQNSKKKNLTNTDWSYREPQIDWETLSHNLAPYMPNLC